MTLHSSALTAERAISQEDSVPYLMDATGLTDTQAHRLRCPRHASDQQPVIGIGTPGVAGTPWARKLLLAGASLVALAGAAYFGWQYWTVGRFEVSTDDAYVQADNTTIAPKVSGYIAAVLVGDNEQVKAGQVLARIDDRDFKVALDQAKADVAAAKAAIANKQASLDSQQSVIDAARATIDVDQANETFAEQDNERYAHLATTGYGSVQNAQQAASRIASGPRRRGARQGVARHGDQAGRPPEGGARPGAGERLRMTRPFSGRPS